MVRNFGEGHYSEQKVAQLTGFLAGASSFSRTFTSMLWGKASDHTGRLVRPSQRHSDRRLGAEDLLLERHALSAMQLRKEATNTESTILWHAESFVQELHGSLLPFILQSAQILSIIQRVLLQCLSYSYGHGSTPRTQPHPHSRVDSL